MRIVLASVLKPVTDPRLLARLGRTLAELPGAEVHILAHVATDAPTARPDTERPNVFLHPIFDFPRLSLTRARAGLTLRRSLRKIKPDLLVVGTAELLPAGRWWQGRTGGLLVYDVRENYALNLRTQGVFPAVVAGALAALIERTEAAAAPHLAGVLLAERVYAEQLPWLAHCRRVATIENKYQPPAGLPPAVRPPLWPGRPVRLLVSGTLSELYGTFDAVAAVRGVRATCNRPIELHLVGHAPQADDAQRLRALAAEHSWLHLQGIETPVPHAHIVASIRHADIGLLAYRQHPSLDGCIPTKLWEYLGEGLPIINRRANGWSTLISETDGWGNYGQSRVAFVMHSDDPAAVSQSLDFASALESQLTTLLAHSVGTATSPPTEAFWVSEAARLLAFFRVLASA